MLKEKQNLFLFGNDFTGIRAMYEVIRTAVNTLLNQFRTMEGVISGGRQRAFVVARFTQQWN